jgi:uncharacterized protein
VRDRYGPWALVVGASDGIGAAFASALAARGLDVALVARRQPELERLSERLRADHGVRTRVVVADVGTRDGLEAAAGIGEEIGLLVVNAALAPIAAYRDLPPDRLDAMLDLNCRAAAHLTRRLGAGMLDRGRGGVILLSSLAGDQGSALVVHYAATKAYLRVLAEGLWAEWGPAGVDVLACCPGLVETPTYERARPARIGALVPPPMTADAVVRAALGALGRRPVVIPGWRNRLSAGFANRLLPRRTRVGLVSRQTRAMYPTGSRRPAPADEPDA